MVIDAGPLIGLLNRRDAYHSAALRGFEQLASDGTTLLVPLPIVFEAFKWLLHRTQLATARTALTWMVEDMQIEFPGPGDLAEMLSLLGVRPQWRGSLEDTAVVQVAMTVDAPVWTIDYRDLAAFPNVRFWNPV